MVHTESCNSDNRKNKLKPITKQNLKLFNPVCQALIEIQSTNAFSDLCESLSNKINQNIYTKWNVGLRWLQYTRPPYLPLCWALMTKELPSFCDTPSRHQTASQ